MSRPLKGSEHRKPVGIRLQPSEIELLKDRFGGVQAAIDYLISRLKPKEKVPPKPRGKSKNGPAPLWHKTARKMIKEAFTKSNRLTFRVTRNCSWDGSDGLYIDFGGEYFIKPEEVELYKKFNLEYDNYGIVILGFKTEDSTEIKKEKK